MPLWYNKSMKNRLFPVFLAVGLRLSGASSTPAGFIDDYDLALTRAKAEEKIVLADFSGSDWCFWCQRLDKEVFTQEAFVSAATNRFVLLMVDSPRDKSRLSEKARDQNPKLVKRYKVTGYPTVLLLNGEGQILGETGFVGGGPEKYLAHLREMTDRIPLFLSWIKPLDKRVSDFYAHYSATMTAAMAEVSDKPRDEQRRIEGETILRLADELDAILAEERAKTCPPEVADDRGKRLNQAAQGADQLRRQGKRLSGR